MGDKERVLKYVREELGVEEVVELKHICSVSSDWYVITPDRVIRVYIRDDFIGSDQWTTEDVELTDADRGVTYMEVLVRLYMKRCEERYHDRESK